MPGLRRLTAALRGLAVAGGYLAVVAWLTWPLARLAGFALANTHAPCKFDLPYSAWVLAHETRALLTAPLHLTDTNIYHPLSGGLFYGQLGLAALPLFAPAFLLTGNPTFAINVTFLLGLALTAAAMHVVVRRWTGSDLAGVVAATAVLLSQWILWEFVVTAPHWATLYGIPLIAFAAVSPATSLRRALLLVPLLVLQCLTDLVYAPPAVMGPLGVLAISRLLRRTTRAAGARLAVALALSALVIAPLYLGYQQVRSANPELRDQTLWKVAETSFPLPLPERLFGGPVAFVITPSMIGLIALGALAAVARRRAGVAPPAPGGWAHGLLWASVGGFLSLTPVVHLAGLGFFRTPLGIVDQWIPVFQVLRAPSRVGIAGLVGLGILSGVGFGEVAAFLRTRMRSPLLATAAGGLLAVVAVAVSYRTYVRNYQTWPGEPLGGMPGGFQYQFAPATPAPLLAALDATPGPLLELPLTHDGLGPNEHAAAMYRSIRHRHPLLNGYASYWPVGFPERMALATRLPDPAALAELVHTTDLALVWVHRDQIPAAGRATWDHPPRTEGRPSLSLVARSGEDMLFAVQAPGAP